MKTIYKDPKAQYLLGADLNVLHHESKEWLNTIGFWKEEMHFFDKLLHLQDPIDKNKQAYRKMLDNLDNIQGEDLSQLEEDVIIHEKHLVKLVQNIKGFSDTEYRDKHQDIKTRKETISTEFKTFKRMVFSFIKDIRF